MKPGRAAGDPAILAGKPVFRGTRIPVELVEQLLEAGWTVEEILEEYPGLRREDVEALARGRASI